MTKLWTALVLAAVAVAAAGAACDRANEVPRSCANLHALKNLTLSEFKGQWLFMESVLLEGYRRTCPEGEQPKPKVSQCRRLSVTESMSCHVQMTATIYNYTDGEPQLTPEIVELRLGVSHTENGKWRLPPNIFQSPFNADIDFDMLVLAADSSKFAIVAMCTTVDPKTWESMSAEEIAQMPLAFQPENNYHVGAAMIIARVTEESGLAVTPQELEGLRERLKSIIGIETYQPDRIGVTC